MQEYWIALIISCLSLGVSVATMLLPVKEWLHHWFPRLWPPSDQNDVHHPADPEPDVAARIDLFLATLAALNRRVVLLEAARSPVGRVQTLDPSAPSNSDGGRDVQRVG